jgi:hypothetical protein
MTRARLQDELAPVLVDHLLDDASRRSTWS